MNTKTWNTRNADLSDLARILQEQHAAKLDMVVPASKIRSKGGVIRINGSEPIIDETGVTEGDGMYRPTVVADEGIAAKLDIPVSYLKRLRETRPDLYDANVNGWLAGASLGSTDLFPADARSFLVRCFRDANGGEGVARAFLSDSYRIVDNLDVLTAALSGIKSSGVDVQVVGCSLSDRRMEVQVAAPSIQALAPVLLDHYRSPFDAGVQRAGGGNGWSLESGLRAANREGQGYLPGEEPVIFAGFVIGNSETGGGAFTITPRLVVQVCKNGLRITADALRSIHLGARNDEGIVRWSNETLTKNLELVTAQATDAVRTFLDAEYVVRKVAEIEAKAGRPVTSPADTIETIGKTLRFSQDTIKGVLDHFIRGGTVTAGGVLQAVTSYAQTVEDADEAAEIEGQAMKALDLASA